MAITDWKIGQEVVTQNMGWSPNPCAVRTKVAALGRKIVTTANGRKFNTDYNPPQEHTPTGCHTRLYSLESWDEHEWRARVRSEVRKVLDETQWSKKDIPLETMLSMSVLFAVDIPKHLQPKHEERLDEIRNATGDDDHTDSNPPNR